MSSEEVILNNFLISLEQDSHICDGRLTVEEYINLKTALASAIKALGEQRHLGEWIDREIYDAPRWKCSECGRTEPYKENFCPNCGLPMNEKALEMIRKREGSGEE